MFNRLLASIYILLFKAEKGKFHTVIVLDQGIVGILSQLIVSHSA